MFGNNNAILEDIGFSIDVKDENEISIDKDILSDRVLIHIKLTTPGDKYPCVRVSIGVPPELYNKVFLK